jgi:hypothetical protein
MEGWKRAFGLHPVEMVIHFVAGGFIVGAFGEASGNDAIIFLAMGGVLLAYAWRRQKAIAALPATGFNSGEVKLAELDAQAEELHELRGRMAELEERLDFTERMLAQAREPEKLRKGS